MEDTQSIAGTNSFSHQAVSGGFLVVDRVSKSFGAKLVLRSVELDVSQGEFLTLLGPSGCGKTTLLRIIGGFERADAGAVMLRDRDLRRVPPERRPFNTVFQSYALFPHMTVGDNLDYGLHASGVGRGEILRRRRAMLELVDLEHAEGRSVTELSGGEQQRVALARALIKEPEVLLLDEPLGALDLQLRRRLQDQLRAIQEKLSTTFIYVTHDQEEALTLSDRVGLMVDGALVQVGSPQQIYDFPVSRFVAEFIGDVNIIPGKLLERRGTQAVVELEPGGRITLPCSDSDSLRVGNPAFIVFRPEHLTIAESAAPTITGQLERSTFLGTHRRNDVVIRGGARVRFHTSPSHALTPGEKVGLDPLPGHGVVVPVDRSSGTTFALDVGLSDRFETPEYEEDT